MQLGAERAVAHFTRPGYANGFGLLSKPIRVAVPQQADSRVPPFIERLWMPAYAVCLQTVKEGKKSLLWTSVDAWSGIFSFLDGMADLAVRAVAEEAFSFNLSRMHAEEIARRGVLQYTLRQRQFRRPVVEGVEEVRTYHFPVWVYYYRRLSRRIDIRVLDAYTGKPGGSRMRMAVINALIRARKEAMPGKSGENGDLTTG